jgi:hypothetical protein
MLEVASMVGESKLFSIEELQLTHQSLSQHGIVITPKNAVVVGRDRIERLRGAPSLSRVDRWLIEQAARRQGRNRIIMFRACNHENERVWQFDPTLSDSELEEAGYLLTCALVPLHRRLLAVGVVLMVHTDWGLRECYAMRHGVRKLESELQGKRLLSGSAVQQADLWLLGNMLLHVALSLEHVTKKLLPLHLGMLERRWNQIGPLLSRLPKDTVE